jgi:hypothetical protein
MNPLAFVRKTDELKNELDKEIIADKLDISSGLKELLSNHGFTKEQLLNMNSSDIADALGIDHDAARLIACDKPRTRIEI